MRKLSFIYILLFLSLCSEAQDLLKANTYSVEGSTYLSTSGQLPYFLRLNNYGQVPLESQIAQIGVEIQHEYDSLYKANKKLKTASIGYGARLISNLGSVSQIILPEAYVKLRLGVFEFYGGRKREIVGLVDSTLTSGSYIWSGNALPIPKLQVSVPNYTPIIGQGLISIKGSFSHGWFGSTDSVQNYYLHQKTFYTRIGRPGWKFKFYTGFNHQVQWGGKPTIPFYDKLTDQIITKYSTDFATYLKVISGISLNRNLDAGVDKDGVPFNEAFNRAGNHLGTLDVAFEFNTRKGKLLLYRQSIYEDGSLYFLSNIADGLNGLSFKLNQVKNSAFGINGICVEYFNTTNQGGSLGSGNSIPELRGRDNYFNNSLYKDGWTYKNQSIGNSLISPINAQKEIFGEQVSSNGKNYFLNNRIRALYFSINGSYKQLIWQLRYLNSANLGSYQFPLNTVKQTSLAFNLDYNYDYDKLIKISIAHDNGGIYPTQIGAKISFKQYFR